MHSSILYIVMYGVIKTQNDPFFPYPSPPPDLEQSSYWAVQKHDQRQAISCLHHGYSGKQLLWLLNYLQCKHWFVPSHIPMTMCTCTHRRERERERERDVILVLDIIAHKFPSFSGQLHVCVSLWHQQEGGGHSHQWLSPRPRPGHLWSRHCGRPEGLWWIPAGVIHTASKSLSLSLSLSLTLMCVCNVWVNCSHDISCISGN